MTKEELEERLTRHADVITTGMQSALGQLSASTLEAARMAEAGPTERLRQNMAAGCYQIRLKACPDDSVAARAERAVLDADAVIFALQEPNVLNGLKIMGNGLRGLSISPAEAHQLKEAARAAFEQHIIRVLDECAARRG